MAHVDHAARWLGKEAEAGISVADFVKNHIGSGPRRPPSSRARQRLGRRPRPPDRRRRLAADLTARTPKPSRSLRHDAAHIVADAVQQLLPRHAGHDRPGDRRGLLLRLLPREDGKPALFSRGTREQIEKRANEIIAKDVFKRPKSPPPTR